MGDMDRLPRARVETACVHCGCALTKRQTKYIHIDYCGRAIFLLRWLVENTRSDRTTRRIRCVCVANLLREYHLGG